MKRKFTIWFYSISLLAAAIAFVLLGKFVWFDCASIIQIGYTDQIGLGMALVLFYVLGCLILGGFVEFVKFCMSSGSPDDK